MDEYEILKQGGKWHFRKKGELTSLGWAYSKTRLLADAKGDLSRRTALLTVYRSNGEIEAIWTFAPPAEPHVRFGLVRNRWNRATREDPLASAE